MLRNNCSSVTAHAAADLSEPTDRRCYLFASAASILSSLSASAVQRSRVVRYLTLAAAAALSNDRPYIALKSNATRLMTT